MTECFWCNEVYDSTGHNTCPSCATDTGTKGFENGRAYEQERILKVLEEHLGEIDWDDLVKLIRAE
jgi:hypothetical protein